MKDYPLVSKATCFRLMPLVQFNQVIFELSEFFLVAAGLSLPGGLAVTTNIPELNRDG